MDIDRPILTKAGKRPQTQDELATIMLDASLEVSIRDRSTPPSEDEAILSELIARPSEFVLDAVPDEIAAGAQHFKKINQLFGSDDVAAKIMMCQIFHDRCRTYQVEHDISGLYLYEVIVGNLSVEYLSDRGLLDILERDKEKLLEQIDIVWNFFINVAATGAYSLFEEDKAGNFNPAKLSDAEEYLKSAPRVNVHTSSYQWVKKDGNWSGSCIERDIPDLVVLYVHTSTDLTISETRCFNLEHRDETRFPWKAK